MSDQRVSPVAVFGLLFLAAIIGGPAWYFTRPKPVIDIGLSLAELNVVCNGRVDVDGALVSLDPSQPGRVVKLADDVKEGATLKKDQPILWLDDTLYQSAKNEALAAVKGVEFEIEAAVYRAKQHPDSIALQEKRTAAVRADVAAVEKQYEQMKSRSELTGQITKTDLEAFAAKITQAKLAAEASELELEQLRKLDTQLEVKGLRQKKAAAELSVERAERGIAECVLKAPSDGTLLRLQVAAGSTLAPGLPLPAIIFAPAGPLIVRAEIEQAGLGRVKVGAKAIVRDDARPDSPVWTGKVRSIAGWISPRRQLLLEPGELNDVRTTEAVIAIEQSPEPLRIGQRMVIQIER